MDNCKTKLDRKIKRGSDLLLQLNRKKYFIFLKNYNCILAFIIL